MKTKVMVTISDIHGSKQYNLYQLIQRFLPWVIGASIVNIAIGILLTALI